MIKLYVSQLWVALVNMTLITMFYMMGVLIWSHTSYSNQWCANPGISNPNPDPNPGTLNPNPAESESTPFFLNPNPNPNPTASNPDSNPAGHRRPLEAARRVYIFLTNTWSQTMDICLASQFDCKRGICYTFGISLVANEQELWKSNSLIGLELIGALVEVTLE